MRRYSPDDFLTLKQLARVLKLDPRTVKRVAFQLGGRRMGQCWRFNWGAVLEFFHADIETRQGRPLAGPRGAGRKADRLQNVPSRKKIRAAMAGRKKNGKRNSLQRRFRNRRSARTWNGLWPGGMTISPMPSEP